MRKKSYECGWLGCKRKCRSEKGKKTGKMKWFCVVKMTTSEAVGGWTMYEHPRVVKAKSRDSAGRDYSRENMRNDYGGVYAPCRRTNGTKKTERRVEL